MLYQRIRDLREDKDMTQTQMAKILSCSQRIYSNYERGDVDIPTDIIRQHCCYCPGHGSTVGRQLRFKGKYGGDRF